MNFVYDCIGRLHSIFVLDLFAFPFCFTNNMIEGDYNFKTKKKWNNYRQQQQQLHAFMLKWFSIEKKRTNFDRTKPTKKNGCGLISSIHNELAV